MGCCVIKSSTLLVKTVDKLVKLEKEGSVIDTCNDVLALLGH